MCSCVCTPCGSKINILFGFFCHVYQKLIFYFLCVDIVKMDQKWIRANRLSKEYKKGVKEFINFVIERADNPCIKCSCLGKVTIEVLRDHLFINGFDTSYTR